MALSRRILLPPSELASSSSSRAGIVFATGDNRGLRDLKPHSVLFLVLSGIGTAISWLAYFKALQMAPASRVGPIDKLSPAFTIVLAAVVLGEPIPCKVGLGATLMVAGALLTLGLSECRSRTPLSSTCRSYRGRRERRSDPRWDSGCESR